MKNKTGLYVVIGLVVIIIFSALVSNLTGKEEVVAETQFNNVSYAEYKALFEGDTLEFVYVGRAGCGYCQATVPLLVQIQEEENIVFNYLDTDTMTETDFGDISNTAEVFAGEWGTPTMLAIYNGEVVEVVSGYTEIENLRTFVENSKLAVGE
jgi:predicted bacteriocin transport accessory protein